MWLQYLVYTKGYSEFQSTHPRRVWQIMSTFLTYAECFNPHTHEGCDTLNGLSSLSQTRFNPHTHEGCDIIPSKIRQVLESFNPHTHEGCDHAPPEDLKNLILFQSTHPRRVWHLHWLKKQSRTRFQSTHPRRVWPNGLSTHRKVLYVSIHTPPKGVTV